MLNNIPQPPELSAYTAEVKAMYANIDGKKKGVFKSLYKSVWAYLFPLSQLDNMMLVYSLPEILGKTTTKISVHEFLALIDIFFITRGGKRSIDSRKHVFSQVYRQRIKKLTDAKFISRTSFDPITPYVRCKQKVFIAITPPGIKFYKDVQKKLHTKAMNDSFKTI